MRSLLPAVAAATCLAAAGCASSPAPHAAGHSGSHGGRPTAPVTSGIEGDLAKTYASLGDLRKDATAVVHVTALAVASTGQAATGSPIPMTLTRVRVDSVVSGQEPASEILIRQLGTSGDPMEGASPLLVPGTRYTLFITQFIQYGTAQPGQFVITGDSGEYKRNGTTNQLASPAGEALPHAVSDSALLAAISAK